MRNIVISFGATGILQLLNLGTGVLAARLLLPEGRGELAAIVLWPTLIASIMLLSIDQSVIFHGSKNQAAIRRLSTMALAVGAPLSALAVAFGYFLIPVVLRQYDDQLITISRLCLLAVPVHFVSVIMLGTLQGAQRFTAWNIVRLLPATGYLVGIVVVLLSGSPSTAKFALAFFSGVAASAVLGVTLVASPTGPWRPAVGEIRKFVRYAAGVHLSSLAALANNQLDRVLVALFLPAEQLGVYVVAASAAGVVHLVGLTIGPISFARIAQQNSSEARSRIFGRYFRLTLLVAGITALVFIVVGELLIVSIFGSSFALAGQILPLMLVGGFCHTIKNNLYSGLKAHGRLRVVSFVECLTLIVQGLALLLLLPRLGVVGAAWSLVVSGATGMVIAALAMGNVVGQHILSVAIPTRDDCRYVLGKFSVGSAAVPDRSI